MPVVILKDPKSEAVLPIWVGLYEANAIQLEVEKATTARPLTHDLLKNVVMGLNAQVQRVVVSELRGDTFYAVIWMEQNGEIVAIDARPSDALALALRSDCPIFVCRGSAACGESAAQRGGDAANRAGCAAVAGEFGG